MFDRAILTPSIQACLIGAVLLVCLSERAAALPVARLEFRGNVHLRSAELSSAVAIAPNPFDHSFSGRSELLIAVQQASDRIRDLYTRRGYIFAAIDSVHEDLAVPLDSAEGYLLTFWISEGMHYTIGSITISGNRLLPTESLVQGMESRVGDELDETEFDRDIRTMLRQYTESGLPFARVRIASLSLDTVSNEGFVHLKLMVDEGKPARIGKIVIMGNSSTARDVILREMRMPVGSLYDPAEVGRARSRLQRLGYFESVSDPDLYLIDDSTVALVLRVQEANTSEIDGVLGYNPSKSFGEAGYISGLVDLGFRNISGTGRDAFLHYARENELSQTLEVAYLEPWLFGYPVSLGLAYSQRQQDTSFTRTVTSARLILSMKEDLTLALSAELDRVVPTDLPNYPFTAFDSRSVVTGLTGSFDSRDDAYAPRFGIRAELGATYGLKSINGPARFIDTSTPSSQTNRTILLDATGYHTLWGSRLVGVLGVHARTVSTSVGLLDDADLFRVGGVYSIRGYREGELLASRFAYATFETRFMTGHESFFFGFCDAGVVVRDSTKSSLSEQVQYPLSYGVGIQLESPLGLLSVSVALPKGEPLDQAKLHFGLVKQF